MLRIPDMDQLIGQSLQILSMYIRAYSLTPLRAGESDCSFFYPNIDVFGH